MSNGVKEETRSRDARDDSGMSAVEFVVLTPLLFLLLMLTVQFAMYLFAKQVATASVQHGARTAREEAWTSKGCDITGKWQQDAIDRTKQQAQELGGQLVLNPVVTPTSTNDPNMLGACQISRVDVTLTADVPSVIPGWNLTINVHAGGPLEQPVRHP